MPQIEFGLERVHGDYVTIPSLFFNGRLPVTPNNTVQHEFEQGDGTFDHFLITDRNGFDVAFWANEALKERLRKLGVPVVRETEVSDDAYTYKLMRLDHEEEMGYGSNHVHKYN